MKCCKPTSIGSCSRYLNDQNLILCGTAEQIAEVVFEAATDGKNTLRYVAGEDAKALYRKRNEAGDETFRKEMGNIFLGK